MTTMQEDCLRSGLTPADMLAVEEAPSPFTNRPQYRIPYFLPGGTFHPLMHRKRFLDDASPRYDQPSTKEIVAAGGKPADASYPYFNPRVLNGVTWADVAASTLKKRLYAIEGEKKSVAVALRCKVFAFGFGGCWNLMVRGDDGIFHLHPEVVKMIHAGDELHIGLDADMATNPEVARAAGSIRRACFLIGVRPVFIVCPLAPNGQKQGLDDWLLTIPPGREIAALDALPRVDGRGLPEDYFSLWKALGLTLGDKKKVVPHYNESNLGRIFTHHDRYTDGMLWYDEVRGYVYENSTGKPRTVGDAWVHGELIWMQDNIGLIGLSASMFYSAIVAAAENHYRRNLIRDALAASVWDKVPRLETMFIEGFGAEDTPYTRAIGQNWLVGAVQRLFEPGCQLDTMLVLEGPQGIGKSSAMSIIGGEYYVELKGDVGTKDFTMAAHTGWIVDMIELASLRRAEANHVKGEITTRVDTFRPPYGRATVLRPRHFALVGTTNTTDYLSDETGNRRFWPMPCGKIDLDWVRDNRDQLLAEAVHEYRAGRQHWNVDPVLTAAEQIQRVADNPLADTLRGILSNPSVWRTIEYKGRNYYFVATSEIIYALNVMLPHYEMETRRISKAMLLIPEWARHYYSNDRRPLTLKTGVFTASARGYITPATVSMVAPVVVTSNVARITPKKFAVT